MMRQSLAALVGAGLSFACGSNPQVVKAKTSGFDTDFEIVWDGILDAVKEEYPVAKVVDRENRRLVTCWRPVERDENARTAVPGSGWRLFRLIIEVSPQRPYRVSISGRSANYDPPQVNPIAHGDVNEPGWVEGRTDRMYAQIYEQLAKTAVPVDGPAAPASDPGAPENRTDTCVIRAAEHGIEHRGMEGIVLGEPGATPSGQVGGPP